MIETIPDLVAFLKRFHRHWHDAPALDPSLIPSDLPPGLATIYRELGELVAIDVGPENSSRTPFATQDGLVALDRLKRVDGMIEFAWENQGNWSARCLVGLSDPPVYSDAADVWQEPRRGFVEVCDSLDHFLITLCLQEAVMSCRNLVSVRTVDDPDAALTIEMQPLWVSGRYVHDEPSHDFYVSSDEEVLLMDHTGVWVGSPTRPVRPLVWPGLHANVLHGQ